MEISPFFPFHTMRYRVVLLYTTMLLSIYFQATSASTTTLPSEDLHHAAMLRRAEVSILGESALLDRETGRVYWEGGSSNTLYESLIPKLDQYGAEHAQAAVLSTLITLAFVGILAGWIRHALDQNQSWMVTAASSGSSSSSSSSSSGAAGIAATMIATLVTVLEYTILRLPTIHNRWLVTASIALYFLESYNCSTRRYLTNALTSTEELEKYIDKLREEQPIVSWHVITYHFERRKIFALLSIVRTWIRKIIMLAQPKQEKEESLIGILEDFPTTKKCRSMFPFTKKVISHKGTAFYDYGRCEDNTIAGVWRRADAISNGMAPFTKIVLTKILVLSDRKSREDYFKQQAEFVSQLSRGDEIVQFSTQIEVPGFIPKMLAVRSIEGVPSAKIFRLHMFWIFTMFGMTVPYRIWFKKHCDSLRVSLVKETYASTTRGTSTSWGAARRWLPSYGTLNPTRGTTFKSFMRGQSLYPTEVAADDQDQIQTPADSVDLDESFQKTVQKKENGALDGE